MKKILFLLLVISVGAFAQTKKPRARDLGIPFEGTPGKYNAITDVAGVEVGYKTLIEGNGKLVVGKGPVRTGVTAIFPRGKNSLERCFAAWFTLNGNGEMTGTTWVDESGCLGSPVFITNTHSVGTVRDAAIEWYVKKLKSDDYSGDISLPVVAETWDGFLNDINGFHVKKEHVVDAIESAHGGPIAEGNIAGVPVGKEITDLLPEEKKNDEDQGSIIVVVATDAPLLPHQLERVVKRVS